jgi:hypothetical protein
MLNQHVEMEAVRALRRTLLVQMAKAFPGQDLTVMAHALPQPPRPIGTARFHAHTRQMTDTPVMSE